EATILDFLDAPVCCLDMGFSRALQGLAKQLFQSEPDRIHFVRQVVVAVAFRCRLGIFDQECAHRLNHANAGSSKGLGKAKGFEILSAEGVLGQFKSLMYRYGGLLDKNGKPRKRPRKNKSDRRNTLRALSQRHKAVKRGFMNRAGKPQRPQALARTTGWHLDQQRLCQQWKGSVPDGFRKARGITSTEFRAWATQQREEAGENMKTAMSGVARAANALRKDCDSQVLCQQHNNTTTPDDDHDDLNHGSLWGIESTMSESTALPLSPAEILRARWPLLASFACIL
ncbi:unnamed protein product, partial [Polarella glacialis]